MIYTPKHFHEQHQERVHRIIRDYNFASLVTFRENVPIVSHLPFLFVAERGSHGVLMAHMARANPQWRSFAETSEALVIFSGPHAYISPRWYASAPDNVPTWNYAVVHVHGKPSVVGNENDAFSIMQKLVAAHDPTWTQELTEKDRRGKLAAIVTFEIEITKIDAKFKLSQNRSLEDRKNVAAKLANSGDATDLATAELMKETLND